MQSGDPKGPPLFLRFMCRIVNAASLGFAGKGFAAACFPCCGPHRGADSFIYIMYRCRAAKTRYYEKRTHPKSAFRSMG